VKTARTGAGGGAANRPRRDPKPGRAARPPRAPADELDEWSTRPVRDRPSRGREKPARFERRSFPADLPPDDPGASGPRRPLSHAGGRVERLEGPSALTDVIQRALAIDPERGVRDHVHGFHSYPARLHPVTAAHLIDALSKPRSSVADPFCGCGTVLVEARRLGRKAIGVDLNPLAVRLTRFKTQPLAAAQRAELTLAAARVTEHAEERRVAAAGPTHRYAPAQREAFDVHVLLELDGLADGIKREAPGFLRQALNLALSSIISKVARAPSAEGTSKRLASGFTIRFFENRVGELVGQLAEYEALLPDKAPGVTVREADARELASLGLKNVDLFVSSPPYPGVLDYAEYHRTRLGWLNIDATEFERLEMGARRHLQRLGHVRAAAIWEADFGKVLAAMRDALAPGGHIALVLADSLLANEPYPADVVVERCARRADLTLVARGSQRRPHFHRQSAKAFGNRPRYEHLLLLARP
jgi:SAM-dependent methyltransferase